MKLPVQFVDADGVQGRIVDAAGDIIACYVRHEDAKRIIEAVNKEISDDRR
jgi:hypothetical protein